MKKILIVILSIFILTACSGKEDLSQYEFNKNGFMYYLDNPQPDSNIQVFVLPNDKDVITHLKITTQFSEDIVRKYYQQNDYQTFLAERNTQQQNNLKNDQNKLDNYEDYSKLTNEKSTPFFSATYSYSREGNHNLEILNFNFCIKDLDLSEDSNKQLLDRYGLYDAYDKETGYLSFKKLLKSKKFEFFYYFKDGMKQRWDKGLS